MYILDPALMARQKSSRVICQVRAESNVLDLFGARAAADGVAATNILGPVARGLAASLPDREITSVVMEFGCYSLTTVLD